MPLAIWIESGRSAYHRPVNLGKSSVRRRVVRTPWGALPVALVIPTKATDRSQVKTRPESNLNRGSSGCDCFGPGFRATCFDGDLDSIFRRIFEGHDPIALSGHSWPLGTDAQHLSANMPRRWDAAACVPRRAIPTTNGRSCGTCRRRRAFERPAKFCDRSGIIPCDLFTGGDVAQGIQHSFAGDETRVGVAAVIDTSIETVAGGAEPKIWADLHGVPFVIKRIAAGEPALAGDELRPVADWRLGEHAAAHVGRLPYFEQGHRVIRLQPQGDT
jgi:hypothetical protein